MKKIMYSIMVALAMLLTSTKLNAAEVSFSANLPETAKHLKKTNKQPDQPVLVLTSFKRGQQEVALITEVTGPIGPGRADVRSSLIAEVSRYLKDINAATKVSAEHIVDICLKEQFDISFLLAQGTLATQMGSTGTGNSLFGFAKRYSHPGYSIVDYIRVISKYYLGNGRDYSKLLTNFVSTKGYRYGSANYEKNLKRVYDAVRAKYRIYDLQNNSLHAMA